MKEGLRSSANLFTKTEKTEVSPSKEMVTEKVGGLKQRNCELTDEENLKLNQEEALKEEMEVNQRDGFKIEECEGKSVTRECSAVEGINNRRKRSRVDGEGESEDSGLEKKKAREVVVRVLRSRSVTETKSKEVVGRGQRTGGSDGSEKKRVEVKTEERDHSDGEDSGKLDNEAREKLKQNHGSSPKDQKSDGSENRLAGVKKKDSDHPDGEDRDHSDHEVGRTLKRKRGRPPKAQKSDGLQKTRIEVVNEESNQSARKESDRVDDEVWEKITPKCGTPPKVQKNDVSEKKRVEVEREERDQSAGEESDQSHNGARERLNNKRGRGRKGQKSDGSEKKRVKAGKEGSHLSVGKESGPSDNEVREKLKPKRGRPPKAKESDESEKKSIEAVEDDIAESSGKESDESYGKVGKKLKPKRGRHSKLNKGVKVGGLRKRLVGQRTRRNKNHNVGARSALSGKELVGKKSNATKLATASKIKCSNDQKEEGRSKQKAVVRDKIIELLLGAGWTIERRPRNGREYCDAVYVNPEGRTHWSVTLAYRVLKQHYEDGGGDSSTSKTGFKFTPLPDEELSMLAKTMGKERSDKNKKKKKWKQGKGGRTGEGVAKQKNKKGKLHKRKLGAVETPGHTKLKDSTKQKSSLRKQDDCAGMSDDGTAVRDHKQLKTHNRKRCALMIRNSEEGAHSDGDGYVVYNGKRTVLAWMIDLGTVPLDGKVQYLKRRKTRTVLKGKITTDGIQCDCCGETFAISDFEAHAGSKSCQPLKNICLENGPSLLHCQLEAWHKQDESDRKGFHFVDTDGQDPNDDTCGICGDGGDLICCDSCPSTFHQSCLEIKKFPSGVWNCTYCSCKFCGMSGGDTCQKDENDAAARPALLTCCLCEEKYHHSCIIAEDTINDHISLSFCGKKCQELYDKLQALLGVKHEMEEGFAWTLVRRFHVGSDISLSGMHRKVECNSKVAVALHIMDECFLPMPDHRSGVNLIRNIVYNFGSNFNRLNYCGFLTAILERGDEIVSAASIRIHGNHLAEMPFIGTRHMYRRQGMCRRLLSAIETALCSLNVEKLVIPAISDLRETWTSVFGFKPLEGSSKQKMRNMKMVVFPGIDMLLKPLLKHHQFAEANMVPTEGLKSLELKEHHTLDETCNSDEKCPSVGFDLKGSSETSVPHTGKINDQAVAVESGSLPDCLYDTSDITSENTNLPACPKEKTADQLSVVPDNLEGRDRSTLNTLDSLCDVAEYQSAVPGSIATSDGERKLEGDTHMDQNDFSVVESKPSGMSFIGSEAADSQGKCQCASKDVTCEVKVEDSSGRQNLDLLDDNSLHTTSKMVTSQPQHLASARELKVSDGNAVHYESTTCNISCDVVQSTTTSPPQKVQDTVNGHCGVLPVNQNIISSCQGKGPSAKEMVVLASVDPNSVHSDVPAKPDLQSCRSNGFCIATELIVSSCGVDADGVHDLKEASNTVQSDALSPDGSLISGGPLMNTKFSEHPGSVSEIEPANLTQCASEPLRNSSSGPGVGLHCASGGGKSCGAPDVIVLSNHAS